jgi:plastocyanin
VRGFAGSALAVALAAAPLTGTDAGPTRFREAGVVALDSISAPRLGCHGDPLPKAPVALPPGVSLHAPGPILALARAGRRVYAVGEWGLGIRDLDGGGALEIHREIRGRALRVLGRRLLVDTGRGQVVAYLDVSPGAQLHEVAVQDNFFDPQDLTVALGDTVRWTNATGLFHNVFSCTEEEFGCDGAAAAEPFTSGPATEFFVFDHTFTRAGANPYLCQPHTPFMLGSVTVLGEAGAPPRIPGGMEVAKLAPDGSALSVSWDTACSAADHEILYGYGFGMPGSTGGGYELAGGVCAIGPASPYSWTGVPPAFPVSTGWVWWLVVATDGAATEGSWGEDGAGTERVGPGAAGSSGACGIATKSLIDTCGP